VLLTEDADLAARARRIRDYGQADRFEHVEVGLNSRLDALQAAILRSALLPRLRAWIDRRRQIAHRYRTALDGTTLRPIVPDAGVSANHLFPVEVTRGEPNEVARRLDANGVNVGRHYPFLCPDQPAVRGRGSALDPLDVARRLAFGEISLPVHPHLRDTEVEQVVEACRAVCG
jgi:dTDP-4-amino-4,6-dideoxygalactose transaminase